MLNLEKLNFLSSKSSITHQSRIINLVRTDVLTLFSSPNRHYVTGSTISRRSTESLSSLSLSSVCFVCFNRLGRFVCVQRHLSTILTSATPQTSPDSSCSSPHSYRHSSNQQKRQKDLINNFQIDFFASTC